MKLARVLIYALILVAVATYVYVVEIQQKEKHEAAQKKAEKLFHLEQNKVDRIRLDGPKGGPIELKKVSDTWVMTSPVKTKADETAVNAVLATLSMASRDRLISEKDVKWKDYGLESPAFTVIAWTKDKKTTLQFGAKNPAKTSYYARLNDGSELLMVQDTLKNALNKTPLNLRDKSIVNIAPQDVDRLSITKAGKVTEFKRLKDNKWEMLKPERIRVKSDLLNRDLRGITNLTAADIIDDPKKEGDSYGLESPSQIIVLGGNKLDQTLLIGQPKKPGDRPENSKNLYARIKGRETVYVISPRQLNAVKTDPEELKDRSLFSFNPADVDKMQIDLQGKKWVLSRGKEGTWQLTEPKKKELKSWPVTSLLWSLKDLEWKSLEKPDSRDLSQYHLQAPKLMVRLHVKDAKDPLLLEAGWAEAPNPETRGPKQNAVQGTGQDQKPESDSKNAPEAASDSNADRNTKEPEAASPDKVYATVVPHEEKEAVFVLEPRFLESLSENLKKLLESK